jgi:hypothetical protein
MISGKDEIIIYSEQVLGGMFSPKVVQLDAWSKKASLLF